MAKANIEITGTNYKLNPKEHQYVYKKCAKLISYIPRHGRESAFISAKVALINQKNDNKYQCDIVLTLPDKTLVAGETGPNALATIDMVEQKIRGQIRRYKTARRNDGVRTGGFMAKIKQSLRRR